MKITLRIQDDRDAQHYRNPLIRAKIPITIFHQPFTSSIATLPSSTTTTSHLSFSLSSAFSSGPSIKLSYSHNTTSSPFSLSLKSGLGLFGSPNNSPLVFTAHFSLSHTNPSFSLHVKPQFGNICLKKTTFSEPEVPGSCSDGVLDSGSGSGGGFVGGFVKEEPSASAWQELSLEPRGGKDVNFGVGSVDERQLGLRSGGNDGFLSGISVMARTVLPVTKRVVVNMRWGVNFPAKLGSKLPYLTVNKIAVETVEEAKGEEEKKSGESSVKDLELLKGMCFWMRRDLEVLEKENWDMKQRLEDMKSGVSGKHLRGESEATRKRVVAPLGESSGKSSGEFERWRKKKGGREENVGTESHTPVKSVREESSRVELKKSSNQASDLESELERAIKAATA